MSQSLNTVGGGDRTCEQGFALKVIPDSTLQTELAAFVAAKTDITELKFVQWTFSNNYEVTSPAANAWPDGRIISISSELNINSKYDIVAWMWSFTDSSGTRRPITAIVNAEYTGSLSLQDPVEVSSATTFEIFQTSASAYPCAVIATDVKASGYCDVLIG